jgi:hypothetical protein
MLDLKQLQRLDVSGTAASDCARAMRAIASNAPLLRVLVASSLSTADDDEFADVSVDRDANDRVQDADVAMLLTSW